MKKRYTADDYLTMPLEELQKLIEEMHQNGDFANRPRKLKSDGKGNIFLNPNDPRDVEWYRNDEDYDIISDNIE